MKKRFIRLRECTSALSFIFIAFSPYITQIFIAISLGCALTSFLMFLSFDLRDEAPSLALSFSLYCTACKIIYQLLFSYNYSSSIFAIYKIKRVHKCTLFYLYRFFTLYHSNLHRYHFYNSWLSPLYCLHPDQIAVH